MEKINYDFKDEIVSVIVAVENKIYRETICNLLENIPIEINVTRVSDGREAIKLLEKNKYEVIFLNTSMLPMNGIEIATIIKNKYHETKIIALSNTSDDKFIFELLAKGVFAYLSNNADSYEIVNALTHTLKSEYYFSNDISGILIEKINTRLAIDSGTLAISKSHQEILNKIIFLLSHEKLKDKIAEILHLAPKTIEHYKAQILEITNSINLAGITVFAYENGLYYNEIYLNLFDEFISKEKLKYNY